MAVLLTGCAAMGRGQISQIDGAEILLKNDKAMDGSQTTSLAEEPPPSTTISEEEPREIISDQGEEKTQTIEEKVPDLPKIELKVILGPQYAQEGLVCFYRVEATVKGQEIEQISFNKDDSNGTWGKNIAQINLMEGQTFTLVCEAENPAGIASESITLQWEKLESKEDDKVEQISDDIDFSDPADFNIDVDLSLQRVRVYYKGEVIKSMICSGGLPETPTPTGTFQTNQKIKYSFVERFGQGAYYWTRFYGSYLFHSVPYDKDGNLQTEELAKIGSPASHGCIRLYLEDAKWMFDYLPLGINVHIGY